MLDYLQPLKQKYSHNTPKARYFLQENFYISLTQFLFHLFKIFRSVSYISM